MKWFKNIFRRQKLSIVNYPLSIEGVDPAPLTPDPDDAELAAQALLEIMVSQKAQKLQNAEGVASNKTFQRFPRFLRDNKHQPSDIKPQTSEYYHHLADRIRSAQEAARLRAMRFVAFVEEKLKEKDLPVSGAGSLGLLEAELMKRIDVIERVGGELKQRWQHCLADVTVRLMQAGPKLPDDEETNTKNDAIDNRTQSLKTTDPEAS